ncbi:MAG: hypothetical protein WCT77_00215 [Bacteroidota bacterium]|jgi:hypothetical protein
MKTIHWVLIGVGSLTLIGCGIGGYFYIKNRNEKEELEAEKKAAELDTPEVDVLKTQADMEALQNEIADVPTSSMTQAQANKIAKNIKKLMITTIFTQGVTYPAILKAKAKLKKGGYKYKNVGKAIKL